MPNANEVIHYLVKFLSSTGMWLRPFHIDVRIFLILWFTEHGQLLTERCDSHEFYVYLLPPNLGTLLLEIQGQTWGCSLFCPVWSGPSKHARSNRNDCKNCRQTLHFHCSYPLPYELRPLHTCSYWPRITRRACGNTTDNQWHVTRNHWAPVTHTVRWTLRAPELEQTRISDGRKSGCQNVSTVYSPKISKPLMPKSTNRADLLYSNVNGINRNWAHRKKVVCIKKSLLALNWSPIKPCTSINFAK